MEYPTPRYSFLAFQLNSLLDQGLSVSFDETHARIDDGSLFDWLLSKYAGEPHYFDLSLYGDAERDLILKVFDALSSGVDAKRKMGVQRNGLALCVGYCIEVMQHPDAYEDSRFDD